MRKLAASRRSGRLADGSFGSEADIWLRRLISLYGCGRRVAWGTNMAEYRRGLASERANHLWHWQPGCPSFPTNAYEIRKDRPADESLCARCERITEERTPG